MSDFTEVCNNDVHHRQHLQRNIASSHQFTDANADTSNFLR